MLSKLLAGREVLLVISELSIRQNCMIFLLYDIVGIVKNIFLCHHIY
jgi:hypothetical protein